MPPKPGRKQDPLEKALQRLPAETESPSDKPEPEEQKAAETEAQRAARQPEQDSPLKEIAPSKEKSLEDLKVFFAKLDARMKDPEKMRKISEWAAKQTDPEVLRRGMVDVKTDLSDFYEKHLNLAAEYLTKVENPNGNITFSVNFKGNETAEWKVGAGHMLPPTVKAIRVIDDEGKVVVSYAERGIRNGRVGYFDTTTGKYALVHSGYKIEVLNTMDEKAPETVASITEERELFYKDGQKLLIKENLQEYFKSKKLDVVIDEVYFTGGLNDLFVKLNESNPNWYKDSAEKKFAYADFEKFFDTQFSQEDFNLMANLSALRDLQAKADKEESGIYDHLALSDFYRLKGDSRFDDLKGKVLPQEELVKFKGEKLKDQDFTDYSFDSKEVATNDDFVSGTDHEGNLFYLRVGAMAAFRKAMAIAKSMGMQLIVNSSHRGKARQAELWREGVAKRGGDERAARKWVATPGGSPHHTGGAVDVYVKVNGRGGIRHANQKYLKQILPRAGFVNYDVEPWHWEIYTQRWSKISGQSGPLYAKYLPALKKPQLASYDDYMRRKGQEFEGGSAVA